MFKIQHLLFKTKNAQRSVRPTICKCREWTFTLFSSFPPRPTAPPPPPPGCGQKCSSRERLFTLLAAFFTTLACSEALNRHKLTFFEGYITLDLDSTGGFRGIGIFCRFFALKDFLSYRPLKKVWADRLTAMRFRVRVLHKFK